MQIGVFSKFETAGGSERRCIELANAVARYTPHTAFLFAEGKLPERLESGVDSRVVVRRNLFVDSSEVPESLYELDVLLVVNTDSKDFCRSDYWLGKSARHSTSVELRRLRSMVFLFNFIVSPSRHLWELEASVPNIKIITANRKFLDEIGEQDRYRQVRHMPRIQLESPIDPSSVSQVKNPASTVRIGMHSTSAGDKWNSQWPELIRAVNNRCDSTAVAWRFMGMPHRMRDEVAIYPNVESAAEYASPVAEFLKDLDIFAFFTSWKREEPWSRSVAEALASGCPVVATPKGGNRDQVVSGNNGLLCRSFTEFVEAIALQIEQPRLREKMANDARRRAREFYSEAVIGRFLRFVTEAT